MGHDDENDQHEGHDERDGPDDQPEQDEGTVSEVASLDPDAADTPISDDQAVAGYPPSESGMPDEGAAGPNANPHADQDTH